MEDKKHPFERLPEAWQAHPVVLRAWVTDLSHQSKKDTGRPTEVQTPLGKLPLPLVILIVLWLMIAHPDKVLKVLGL